MRRQWPPESNLFVALGEPKAGKNNGCYPDPPMVRMRFTILAMAATLGASVHCGGSVDDASRAGTTGGQTSGGGAAGGAHTSASAGSTSTASVTSTSGAGGSGGAGGDEGAGGGPPIGCSVTLNPAAPSSGPNDFAFVCEWGDSHTSCPVAYDVIPGVPGGQIYGVIEACRSSGPVPSTSNHMHIQVPGGLAAGFYQERALQVGTDFGTVDLTITEVGAKVTGSFVGTYTKQNQQFPAGGTFEVVRVPDRYLQ